jgi:predicted secreted hydrolase
MRGVVTVLAMLAALAGCENAVEEGSAARLGTGLRLLGGEAGDGFARATEPRPFTFPVDHGSHPDFRTEWWYFTGNLATASGRHFGFELTFFRYALAPDGAAPDEASRWRARQLWMAHFAITDTEAGRFIARERLAREALGLAGAATEPWRVWVKDWTVSGTGAGNDFRAQLAARDDAIGLNLSLTATVPHIAQGDRGVDVKGNGNGNASHYYSIPRLAAEGEISVEGERFQVAGLAWLDREWSTSSLDAGTEGWDWFALHLSDGSNLMFYRLRTHGGTASEYSGGVLVGADGLRTRLGARDVVLTVLDEWRSERTGVRYPVAWRLTAAGIGVDLEIRPYLEHQELDLSVRYWEGAVQAEGRGPAGPLTGEGYLELAGY